MKSNIETNGNKDPQLLQMVLENTEKIKKNEQKIKRIRMENREYTRAVFGRMERLNSENRKNGDELNQVREILQRIAASHEESDKRREQYKRESEERDRKFEADLKKSQEERDEFYRRFEEDLKKSREELDASLKRSQEAEEERRLKREEAWRKSDERFNRRMEKLDEKVTEMSINFIGAVGHIVEGLASSKVEEMFLAQGYEITDKKRNLHRKVRLLNSEMEADVVLLGPELAIVIEVKSSCDREDIDKFTDHMRNRFRGLFPEWNHLEVLGAVAAFNYENDADDYAHRNGLLVIRTNTRNVFSLDKSDRDSLARF